MLFSDYTLSMSKHTSDFRKIGQSGPTIDGRTIEPQWLLDIAETYAPTTYTAMIWPDHMRWFGNYGTVEEVKTETTGGVVSLYARITPNGRYLWENGAGQKLFFSMEVEPNFAGTGKAYLVGLAVTDNPASLGTEETRFASRKQQPENLFIGNVAFEAPAPPASADEPPSWFTKFIAPFLPQKTEPTEEHPMDAKQFEAFTSQISGLTASVNSMNAQFTTLFTAKPDAAPAETPPAAPPADPARDAFTAQLTAMQGELEKLSKGFGDVAARLELAQQGTKHDTTTGPADDAGIL